MLVYKVMGKVSRRVYKRKTKGKYYTKKRYTKKRGQKKKWTNV